jgi:hypothetical protein
MLIHSLIDIGANAIVIVADDTIFQRHISCAMLLFIDDGMMYRSHRSCAIALTTIDHRSNILPRALRETSPNRLITGSGDGAGVRSMRPKDFSASTIVISDCPGREDCKLSDSPVKR